MVSILKKQKVEKLQENIQEAKNFFLIKYGSISHQDLEKIRRKAHEIGAKIKVVKNSLFQKAINKLSHTDPLYREFRKKVFPLKENTAVVLDGKDIYDVLKQISDFAKEHEELELKGGLIDEVVYSKEDIKKLASLPSKQELLAKIYAGIKAPISRIHRSITYPYTRVYLIIKELSKKGNSEN